MAGRKKRRLAKEKRPIEMTTDEAMEQLFSKEVRDKLKKMAGKPVRNGEKPPHK
jgi:hypothetical protein